MKFYKDDLIIFGLSLMFTGNMMIIIGYKIKNSENIILKF